jgi:hypothetical protein
MRLLKVSVFQLSLSRDMNYVIVNITGVHFKTQPTVFILKRN